MTSSVKAIYIHIPFCKNICSYCDFCKLLYNKKFVDSYLDALGSEINELYQGEVVDTIYIGGGTPSSLSYGELKRLFNIIGSIKRSKTCEFTIEGNFDTTDKEKLDLYKSVGVNRLSFGIETVNHGLLKFLERNINKEEIVNIVNYANSIGLTNINVDLMYALIDEDIDMLKKDLDFITSLNIKHISTYSLIIEKNTKLYINNIKNIDEDLDYDMYIFICNYLKNKGFNHYEISNFSLPGYESRHNLVYWNNLEYYGFGLGASSYIGNRRISNTRSLTKYIAGNRIREVEVLDIESKMEYEIILSLRTSYGISKEKFKKVYGRDIDKCYNYSSLVNNLFIIEDDDHLYINPDKWYISNEIILEFLEGVL